MTTSNSTTTISIDKASPDVPCPRFHRTFTSRIGLFGHLRIHRKENDEPLPEVSTYSYRLCLQCPHSTLTFTYYMGLLGCMRLHENLRLITAAPPSTRYSLSSRHHTCTSPPPPNIRTFLGSLKKLLWLLSM
ncbi:unnamed protein product [Schistocephalus solidus]|uniref:C2H2-type domain-containing protein n=1 Tax=Schistocephalus solidus TaxID=70667 RepID=A0A183SD28_SCHSO|nr:unnamed protein product [Schistocephalus solidus]